MKIPTPYVITFETGNANDDRDLHGLGLEGELGVRFPPQRRGASHGRAGNLSRP
jgi:hypothetical protein